MTLAFPSITAPAVTRKVGVSSADSNRPAPCSLMSDENSDPNLSQRVQAAIDRLLGVSSAFKDLQPGKDIQVSTREETIAMMQHYLKRLNLGDIVDDSSPRALSVVHVAGTKGKGSTCAMVERILRQAGYKTGLFTSPHLISPCERFRINGKPITDKVFLKHFYAVWDGLEKTQDQSGSYPPMAWFFRFLTLMALHLFTHEKVDVVVLEVGLGGRLDATNVFRRPVVCGISVLDLDHTRVLGGSIDQIAYSKAGIFKPGVPAFTTAQEPLAMKVLEKCAAKTATPLTCVPTLDEFGPDGVNCQLGLHGEYQRTNAGLAVALASTWLRYKRNQATFAQLEVASALEAVVKEGLKQAFWPGRAQLWDDKIHKMCFYIDGAHTKRSIECCANWYRKTAIETSMSRKRVLIFTIHHERNVAQLFESLLTLHFDYVYFCPTSSARPSLAKVHTFSEALIIGGFQHVIDNYSSEELVMLDDVESERHPWQTTLSRIWSALLKFHTMGGQSKCVAIKDSVMDCIHELRALSQEGATFFTEGRIATDEGWEKWSVLVTGSLYLCGETLDFLGWQE
ncbi:folylpolyglutamate mitochondrial-like [Plasmopara halstedii]|uniref:tetrahydrofolate synthase n=1 Tax=Plasmopara halstedii TaxID=4781 RepID=A0A0P1AV76_PLAHL|nr:folylpolyglutamate mitochondrial-like [Plasmopara halstedii]CEG45217.1 folylpolyglutamate mitochondrial-like [Plasmopara halstedii]|eukprot:XP_024581586.1 folylpolyglutamate mitochondrial-like [Plasmopara halstedii]